MNKILYILYKFTIIILYYFFEEHNLYNYIYKYIKKRVSYVSTVPDNFIYRFKGYLFEITNKTIKIKKSQKKPPNISLLQVIALLPTEKKFRYKLTSPNTIRINYYTIYNQHLLYVSMNSIQSHTARPSELLNYWKSINYKLSSLKYISR